MRRLPSGTFSEPFRAPLSGSHATGWVAFSHLPFCHHKHITNKKCHVMSNLLTPTFWHKKTGRFPRRYPVASGAYAFGSPLDLLLAIF